MGFKVWAFIKPLLDQLSEANSPVKWKSKKSFACNKREPFSRILGSCAFNQRTFGKIPEGAQGKESPKSFDTSGISAANKSASFCERVSCQVIAGRKGLPRESVTTNVGV